MSAVLTLLPSPVLKFSQSSVGINNLYREESFHYSSTSRTLHQPAVKVGKRNEALSPDGANSNEHGNNNLLAP